MIKLCDAISCVIPFSAFNNDTPLLWLRISRPWRAALWFHSNQDRYVVNGSTTIRKRKTRAWARRILSMPASAKRIKAYTSNESTYLFRLLEHMDQNSCRSTNQVLNLTHKVNFFDRRAFCGSIELGLELFGKSKPTVSPS